MGVPGTPPTLTVDNRALVLTETDPVPTRLAGQAVTRVADEIRFVPGYTGSGNVTAEIMVDRSAGTITAYEGGDGGLPTDRSGDGSWIVSGLPPGDPGAPATVTLDLEAVTGLLGIQAAPDSLGIGLRRSVTLADGSTLVGEPVTATLDWYQSSAVPAEPAPAGPVAATEAPSGSATGRDRALVVAAAVAAVLLLVALVLWWRSRRRRRELVEPDADLDSFEVWAAQMGPATGSTPIVRAEREPAGGAASGSAAGPVDDGARADVEQTPDEVAPVEVAPVEEALDESAADAEPSSSAAGPRTPDQVLAAFDAQLAELLAAADGNAGPRPAPSPEAQGHAVAADEGGADDRDRGPTADDDADDDHG